jgi:hypothetical protein
MLLSDPLDTHDDKHEEIFVETMQLMTQNIMYKNIL